ncbi:MAG: hypothetical protein EA342_14805 [Leptolyngbya sp. LCM1.Bin17]|nr:MAG: hypothetical protein EA342_14805 [Leptolyngbya sp. LCM1.Bin17]
MANVKGRQRVAIAGTVTNMATTEGLPQVLVRITHAPQAFVDQLTRVVQDLITPVPDLSERYRPLLQRPSGILDSLHTLQMILDEQSRNHGVLVSRPVSRMDQTLTGGDGHYYFLDLPPGLYTLTAVFVAPGLCYGFTRGHVQVQHTDHWLTFSQLDLALTLTTASPTAGFLAISPGSGTGAKLTPWASGFATGLIAQKA